MAVFVLLFLHRRNVRRLRMEDAKDPNVGLDFGLDEPLQRAANARASCLAGKRRLTGPASSLWT